MTKDMDGEMKTAGLSARIEALECEEAELTSRLEGVRREIKRLKLEQFTEETGVQEGAIVIHKGEEHLVRELDKYTVSMGWLRGVPRTKSGEWSKRALLLCSDWKLKEAEA